MKKAITTDALRSVLRWLKIWYEKKGLKLSVTCNVIQPSWFVQGYDVTIEIEERDDIKTSLTASFYTCDKDGNKYPINDKILKLIERIDEHLDSQWHVLRDNNGYEIPNARYPKVDEEVIVVDTYCRNQKDGAFQARWSGHHWMGSINLSHEFGLGSDLYSVAVECEIYAWRKLPRFIKPT